MPWTATIDTRLRRSSLLAGVAFVLVVQEAFVQPKRLVVKQKTTIALRRSVCNRDDVARPTSLTERRL